MLRWRSLCLVLLIGSGSGWAHALPEGLQRLRSSAEGLEFQYTLPAVRVRSLPGGFVLPEVPDATIAGPALTQPIAATVRFAVEVPGPSAIEAVELVELRTRRVAWRLPTAEQLGQLLGQVPPVDSVPEEWVRIRYAGIARGVHLAHGELLCVRAHGDGAELLESARIRVRLRPQPAPAELMTSPPASLPQSIPAGRWVRIGVQREGIYRITAEQLRQLGVRIAPEEVPTLKLFGIGGAPLPEERSAQALQLLPKEQPLLVRTNASGELQEILFYGAAPRGFYYRSGQFRHWVNPYTNTTFYVLTWGGAPGLRATPLPPPEGPVTLRPSSHTARVFIEEELYQPFALGSGREWLGPMLDAAIPVVYTMPLTGLERSDSVLYRFVVVNRATSRARFTVWEGNQQLWSGSVSGTAGYTEAVPSGIITVRLPASALPADNRSTLRFTYTPDGYATGFGHVDWVEWHFPRAFTAVGDELEWWTDPSWSGVLEIAVTGFSGGPLWGFEVTDPAAPQLLTNLAGAPGSFVVRFVQDSGVPRRFFVSARVLEPAILEPVQSAGLLQAPGAELVVITHPQLLGSAQEYQRYRQGRGISTMVVTTEQIYTEFAAGNPDPTAIRNFLAWALRSWSVPPRWVLLWGDGHYDYKNISTQQPNFVPTYQSARASESDAFNAIDSYCTDDYYTWVQGDDRLPDIAIGRMPINSDAEGMQMVQKLRLYETASDLGLWRATITLVADDGPTSYGSDGSIHTDQSETLAQRLPEWLWQRKLYLAEYPTENLPGGRRKPEVTRDLVAAVNAGTAILNWIGHGNPRLWAHEQVLERETTIPQFQNLRRLFFLTAATCDFVRYDDPRTPSGAEAMLLSPLGGAIAVFGAARLVYSTPNAQLLYEFYDRLLRRSPQGDYPTLGEVQMLVKQLRTGLNDLKFVLLGDPSLRLLLPTAVVALDSINGRPIGSDSLASMVSALQLVRLSGRILDPSGERLLEDFSGQLLVVLTDAPVQLSIREGSFTTYRFTRVGPVLHQGTYAVSNGRWSAAFRMPLDADFSGERGRFYLCAFADDGRSAAGSHPGLSIQGIAPDTTLDTLGPTIRLYLDHPDFRPGDIVRSTPVLFVELEDASGINTAAGVGHRILAWIDEDPKPIDLTPLYQPSLQDPRRGIAMKPLVGLPPGLHRVRVRAWDIYNNFGEAETTFRIAESTVLVDAQVLPNPATEFPLRIRLRSSASAPEPAHLQIADLWGRIVYEQQFQLLPTWQFELAWDGRTAEGAPVAPGMYVYTVRLLSEPSRSVRGTFVIVR